MGMMSRDAVPPDRFRDFHQLTYVNLGEQLGLHQGHKYGTPLCVKLLLGHTVVSLVHTSCTGDKSVIYEESDEIKGRARRVGGEACRAIQARKV